MGSSKEQVQLHWVQLRGKSQLSWAQLHFVSYSPYISRCKKSLNNLSYLSLINVYVRDIYLLLNVIRKNDTPAPSLYKKKDSVAINIKWILQAPGSQSLYSQYF
jgi:hypothetical protein